MDSLSHVKSEKDKENACYHADRNTQVLSRRSQRPATNWRWVTGVFAVGTATTSSLVINAWHDASMVHGSAVEGYSFGSVSTAMPRLSLLSYSWSDGSRQRQWARLSPLSHDPKPIRLIVACLVYSIAMNVFYHIHKSDKYQLGILACGAMSAWGLGLASGENTPSVLTGLGPWAVMVSLVLSAAFHRARGHGEMVKTEL
ncbi:unnamed protein product [Alternaria burnsii]|nr:unnamed protein product [Alternaria burnsii]